MTRISADVESCYCVNVFMVYAIRIEKTQPDSSDLDLISMPVSYTEISINKKGVTV